MKLSGPIVTLIAGAGLAGALLVANLTSTSSPSPAAAGAATATATPPATTPHATTSPAATASGTASAGTPDPVAAAVRRGTYVGRVSGAGQLALVVRDGAAIAYLCDGRSIEAWFQGSATGGTLQLTGRKGARLVGSYNRAHATGTIVTGGVSRQYDLAWVSKPSGLYRATAQVRGAAVQAGWIVLPDGSQVGLLSNSADGTEPKAAPRLDVASTSATLDGATLDAMPVDSESGSGF